MTEPVSAPPQPEPPEHKSKPVSTKASDVILEFYKLVPATSGIMLALIWGLTNRTPLPAGYILLPIRIASLFLAASILVCFIGLADMMDTLHAEKDPYSSRPIRVWVYIAWSCFLIGVLFVIISLFLI